MKSESTEQVPILQIYKGLTGLHRPTLIYSLQSNRNEFSGKACVLPFTQSDRKNRNQTHYRESLPHGCNEVTQASPIFIYVLCLHL